jgi:lipopolysaccharide transport system ATP-binding protein
MQFAIQTENIGKRYRVGGLRSGQTSFRESLTTAITAPLRRLRDGAETRQQTLWALRDVNLEVQPGELLGIIGHNGAGKSTLLKILSRVVKPTTGHATIYGRVGSMLEIGTGFHEELTGRENIFMSGAILGMSRAEIQRKFDEIVEFAELAKFLETPLKWYSSGMYVRLAFAVAAHLEPEILMMDEVLAVGDASFQQKCFDKMHDIRQQGRTILFVSHDMAAITRVCGRAVLLEKGHITADGSPREIVTRYLSSTWTTAAAREWTKEEAPGDDVVKLRRVRVRLENGETATAVDIRNPVGIEVRYDVMEEGHALVPVVELYNEDGTELFSTHDTSSDWRRRPRARGGYLSTVWIPGNLLAEGIVMAHVSLMSHHPATELHAHARNAVAFHVVDSQSGDSARGDYVGPMPGVVRPLLQWTTETEEANK